MAKESCYCGLRVIEIEHASYYVDGAACCSRQCYNEAVVASPTLDKDGFMWGGPPEPVAKPLH